MKLVKYEYCLLTGEKLKIDIEYSNEVMNKTETEIFGMFDFKNLKN